MNNPSSLEISDDFDEYPEVTQADLDRAVFRVGLQTSPRNKPITINFTDKLRKVLALIHAGQSSFEPRDKSDEALKEFQFVAKCLIYAKQEELIDTLIPHQNKQTEQWLYDLFILRGGLTYKGEQFLKENDAVISGNAVVVKELVMGDSFSNINHSTVVSRSEINHSLNTAISEEKKTLAESCQEIQTLLKQLEKTHPAATDTEKIAYIDDETSRSFKRRASSALKACGEATIDEFVLDNKYLKVLKAMIKGWLQSVS